MGGDHGPSVVVPAALAYVRDDPSVTLILVGREEAIRKHLPGGTVPAGIELQAASEEVAMDELPSKALRGKKDSSMRVAIDLVKAGRASACVSAGNTGALMATARFVLKTLPQVDRPAEGALFLEDADLRGRERRPAQNLDALRVVHPGAQDLPVVGEHRLLTTRRVSRSPTPSPCLFASICVHSRLNCFS